jgi:hypothetical protein
MTYREIANEINYTGYASTIAQANGGDESTLVKQGSRIIIPNLYFEVADTAWNGALPSVDRIIGSLYAVASNPQVSLKPKKEHINWVEKFAEVAGVRSNSLSISMVPHEILGATRIQLERLKKEKISKDMKLNSEINELLGFIKKYW